LIIVDLSERGIDRCRQRFADCSHSSYFVNDGKALEMVLDGGVDFIFSHQMTIAARAIAGSGDLDATAVDE
jgi:hypothetical protein